jgi:hypothetical protein
MPSATVEAAVATWGALTRVEAGHGSDEQHS